MTPALPAVRNLRPFLDLIAYSELGLELLAVSDNGYDVIVGSTAARPILFDSYADHPRRRIELWIKGRRVLSTAAGRYQVLERYYDHYRAVLDLADFSPASQDAIAVRLIRECRALDDIDAGDVGEAIFKCRGRWASLPGAGYGQHERDVDELVAAYRQAGGHVA